MAKKKSLEWLNCSEAELRVHLAEWVREVDLSNAIIFLNGEMGTGKSTFARALLELLAPGQWSKGSPTFPLVQEYRGRFPIYHIDLYRLKSDAELEESGILSQIEERGALAMVEWGSMFAASLEYWTREERRAGARARAKAVWTVEITAVAGDALRRDFRVR